MKMNESKTLHEKIAEKAKEFLEYFELATRAGKNEEKFYTVCNHADEALDELIRKAHGDLLPDDFCYETIHDALCAFAECESEDQLYEVNLEPDIYYHELLKWLSSHLKRMAYCDEAIAEFGLQNTDLMTLVAHGQQREQDEIVALIRESLIALCEA